jgi:hypothetical protein
MKGINFVFLPKFSAGRRGVGVGLGWVCAVYVCENSHCHIIKKVVRKHVTHIDIKQKKLCFSL